MRTLKKALCLVLVLAMVLSLSVSAFAVDKAADYKDYSKVENKEAVDVLTAIGVLNGNDDGTFGPDGAFTRAQAAKMIAVMQMGTTVAEALPVGATQYNDVPATHWASKYIQYCSNEGIIVGNGDGTFGPEDTLSASAWCKMLLCALGYDAAKEGLTGTGWEINVTRLAMQAKVATADELATAFNRDMAAQFAFNTLKANEVTYAGGTVIQKDGDNYVIVTVPEGKVAYTGETFMANHFPKLSITTPGDEFGRPADYVVFNGKEVGTYAKTPVATFTTPVTEKALYEALGSAGFSGKSAKFVVLAGQTEDGVTKATANLPANDEVAVSNAIKDYNDKGSMSLTTVADSAFAENVIVAKGDTSVIPGTGYGTTTEVYATAYANVYTIVFINEYLGTVTQVTKANATTESARSITIDGTYSFETEDFAKSDAVLYTKANGKVMSVTAPETLTGKVTKIANGSIYTIGDATVAVSNKASGVSLTINKEGTWYVDSCGNVIGVKQAANVTKYYGVVVEHAQQAYQAATLLTAGKDTKEVVKFYDATGAVQTLDTAWKQTYDTKGNITGQTFVSTKLDKGTLFIYTLGADGKIASMEAAPTGNFSIEITKGNSKTGGTYQGLMTDKTVVFYTDKDGNIAAYTGYTNIPTKAGTVKGYVTANNGAAWAAILVAVDNVDATTSANYVYFGSADKTVETTSAGTVVTYTNVYVNGVKAEEGLKFSTDPNAQAGAMYTFVTNTTTGMSTLSSLNLLTSNVEITSLQSTYFVANSVVVFFDTDTVFYEVDTANKTITKVDGITALSVNDSYSVNLMYNDKGTAPSSAADVVVFNVGE